MVTGTSVTYIAGNGHRPIPKADDTVYRKAHTPKPKKPTGLDWDAITPRCTTCGQKSGQLDNTDTCPPCRGIQPNPTRRVRQHGAYEQRPEELERRFTAPTGANHQTSTEPAPPGPGGDRPAAATEGEAVRQPVTRQKEETAMTAPPFPTYIVDIAVVMRDSENHHDARVRAARKVVANALVALNRELTRTGDPAASTRPDELIAARRPSRLDPHREELIASYSSGSSPMQLGKRYGVSDVAIRHYLKREGVALRSRAEAQVLARSSARTTSTGDTAA